MSDLRNKQYPLIRTYEELLRLNETHSLLSLMIPNRNGNSAIIDLKDTEEFRKRYMSPLDMAFSPAYLNYEHDLKKAIADERLKISQ